MTARAPKPPKQGFNAARLNGAIFKPRTEKVLVQDLADWFDGEPIWEVRGLTGPEIAKAKEASDKNNIATKIIEALNKQNQKDKADAAMKLMGLGEDTPANVAERIDHLMSASIDPTCDRSTALRLFEHFPMVAYTLTNKILELTGLGSQPGKQKASTATPT